VLVADALCAMLDIWLPLDRGAQPSCYRQRQKGTAVHRKKVLKPAPTVECLGSKSVNDKVHG
jgi:hypothetical protein